MEAIIESQSGYSASLKMKVVLLVFGIYCIYSAFSAFEIYKIIVAVVAFYGIVYKKRIYVSSNGLVREVRGVLGTSVEVLPWEEIKAATVVYKGDLVMVFFKKGITGWKILFKREDERLLRELLCKYSPDDEVTVVSDVRSGPKIKW